MLPTPAPDYAAEISRQRIAHAFGTAASTYDQHAALQRDVAQTLCSKLSSTVAPADVLDLGCGTGYCVSQLKARFGAANVYALDLAEPMVERTRAAVPGANVLCGDIASLPLASQSVDVICSSLALQWSASPNVVFDEARRVLRPEGVALFSTFGPKSLCELREAWAKVDPHTHVNRFTPADELLNAAFAVGLKARCETQLLTRWYGDLRELARELKGIGAHNMNEARPKGLTGRASFAQVEKVFAANRVPGRGVPVTYEILYLIVEHAA